MKYLLILVLAIGSLMGCNDTPGDCDYCHTKRPEIWQLACLKCTSYHSCCNAEQTLMARKNDMTWLITCPKPVTAEKK